MLMQIEIQNILFEKKKHMHGLDRDVCVNKICSILSVDDVESAMANI